MFARVKKSGKYQYLQIVQNRREGQKTVQRVLTTIGRLDQMHRKGERESSSYPVQALQEIMVTEDGRSLLIRSEAIGTCGKVFQAAGVALPPTIREL
jgi:hypothetical protein